MILLSGNAAAQMREISPLNAPAENAVASLARHLSSFWELTARHWSYELSGLTAIVFLMLLFSNIRLKVQLKRSNEKLHDLARLDELTRLADKRLFNDVAGKWLYNANRAGVRLTVIYIDIDQFKPINDTYGNAVGDKLLQNVADRIVEHVRSGDIVARIGGDEFAVLWTHDQGEAALDKPAMRLLNNISTNYHINGHDFDIDCTLGVALYPEHGEDLDTLLHHADTALDQAKESGRGGYHLYSDETYAPRERASLH